MEKQIYNRRKTLFGNEETAALYYAAKDIIFEYEIYKPYSIYDDEIYLTVLDIVKTKLLIKFKSSIFVLIRNNG
ncbi:hypothetical protein P2M48_07625 [Mannheimia haemolytica]|uniref:hypothetical protein n=1 Tax=Mannheimia haemolytica TaxID=75985 RepID=UPI001F1D015C|nr:hypothetical protein [Mannheimia haemolytica]MDW1150060.1 hypothetical protein [Mannheimia haemolytica]MDW1160271.1 hypothetical protein [Mannheimia haemolytica]